MSHRMVHRDTVLRARNDHLRLTIALCRDKSVLAKYNKVTSSNHSSTNLTQTKEALRGKVANVELPCDTIYVEDLGTTQLEISQRN